MSTCSIAGWIGIASTCSVAVIVCGRKSAPAATPPPRGTCCTAARGTSPTPMASSGVRLEPGVQVPPPAFCTAARGTSHAGDAWYPADARCGKFTAAARGTYHAGDAWYRADAPCCNITTAARGTVMLERTPGAVPPDLPPPPPPPPPPRAEASVAMHDTPIATAAKEEITIR